jgi:hypothetical protein
VRDAMDRQRLSVPRPQRAAGFWDALEQEALPGRNIRRYRTIPGVCVLAEA